VRTRLTTVFNLTAKDIEDAINAPCIFINGIYYHIPVRQLMEYRDNRRTGKLELTLTSFVITLSLNEIMTHFNKCVQDVRLCSLGYSIPLCGKIIYINMN